MARATNEPHSAPEIEDGLLDETPRWHRRAAGRRDDLVFPALDDLATEDEWAVDDRRRSSFLVSSVVVATAVAIGIVVTVGYFGPARISGSLGRLLAWSATDRGPAPIRTSERAPNPKLDDADSISPPDTRTSPPIAGLNPSEAPPTPAEPGSTAASETGASSPRTEAPSRMELPAHSMPPRPTPARSEGRGTRTDERLSPGPVQELASLGSSEERMAAFLITQFGPTQAEEKALSNAALYTAVRSERAYWQAVAAAVRKREGR